MNHHLIVVRDAAQVPHVNPLSTVLVATHGGVEQRTADLAGQLVLPPGRVIGLGTVARTIELRRLISETLKVSEHDVAAHAAGVDGPDAVILWHAASIAGLPIEQAGLDAAGRAAIAKALASWSPSDDEFEHAVHVVTVAIAAAKAHVLTVCVADGDHCISLPRRVADNEASIPLPLAMSDAEKKALQLA